MLDVKYSNVFGYVLFYDKEQVYLIDTKYTNSLFNFPKTPEKIALKAYHLEPDLVSNFEVDNNKSMGNLTAVLITQPFVTLIYNLGKYIFKGFEENYYVITKLFLLFVVLAITILSSRIYLKSLNKKIPKNVRQKKKHLWLHVYKPENHNEKKSFVNHLVDVLGYIIGIMIIGIPLFLYFKINDGTESVLLIVISFIFFILYGSTKMSPIAAPVYQNYNFAIKNNPN